MIGTLRLSLALLIMAAHLTQQFAMASHLAVLGFYLMGGYFATYAKAERYNDPWAFWASRYLRIWPGYLAVFVATYALLMACPDISPNRTGIPYSWSMVSQQFMLVPNSPQVAMVPVGWMIKWLLLGYGLIALGATNSPRISFGWVVVAFILAQPIALTQDYATYYFSWQLALLGMALGSTGYWLGITVPRDSPTAAWLGAISFPIYLTHPVIEVVGLAVGLSHGWPLFWLSLPPTLIMSYLLVIAVERPIARYRAQFRHQR